MLHRAQFLSGAALAALASIAPGAAFAWPVEVADAEAALRADGLDDLIYPDKATLAQPPRPFVSNHNYFIYGGGSPIVGLVVTIAFEEDLVAPASMGMQLTANSDPGAGCVYQQYVTGMSSSTQPNLVIGSSIENFPSKAYRAELHRSVGLRAKGDLFNVHHPGFATFPNKPGGTIPAGFKIRYELGNDASGRVTGATYTVTDENGREQTTGFMRIRSFDFDHTTHLVSPGVLAPIYAFQMNMVGINGGRFTYVSAGKGTITYEAQTMLTPVGKQPKDIAAQGVSTAETSNILYAELRADASTKIVQRFHANPKITSIASGSGGTTIVSHGCERLTPGSPTSLGRTSRGAKRSASVHGGVLEP